MPLELNSDQRVLAAATRDFLHDRFPSSAARELRDDPDGFDRNLWRQGAEQGWTSLLVSEQDGGGSVSGKGLEDLTMIAFEFGRVAAPGPLVGANVVASAISRNGSAEQKASFLDGLLSGTQVGTWANGSTQVWGRLNPPQQTLKVVARGAEYVLTGYVTPVEAAAQAELFLVSANDGEQSTQFLVPSDTPGVVVTPMRTLDLTRRFGRVEFNDVVLPSSAVLGDPGGAGAEIARQLAVAVIIQLSEVTGAMDRALELTLAWLNDRYSFGRPLSSYQVLKHRYVDMRSWLEGGIAIVDAAAAEVEAATDRADEYVSAAKSYVGQYGPEALHDCVQMHGGIGVTFEHDLHLFLRRVVLSVHTYGTVADHRERLTTILERQETANV